MTPETQLLLCCAGAQRDPGTSARIQTILERGLDWDTLLLAAHRHRLVPLLAFHLGAASTELTPSRVLAYLRGELEWNARRSLYLTEELLGILELLHAHDVGAIPFKGPVLAVQAYGNLALRSFVDLDLLISPHDLGAAKRLLIARGYHLAARPIDDRVLARCGYELALRRDDRLLVELQWALGPPSFSFNLSYARMRARLQPLSMGGRHVRVLSREDSLLTSCVHGAKHRWSRLGWLCDVAELVRTNSLNWDRVLAESREVGGQRMLLVGVTLAEKLLDVPLPPDVVRAAHTDAAVHTLVDRVRETLMRTPPRTAGAAQHTAFYMRTRERLADRVRIAARLALRPTVDDWRACPLPRSLAPLQYLLRPVRLAAKLAGLALRTPPMRDLGAFEATPPEVVEKMLTLARVGPTDIVYDLGCGDGRVVITAATKFGARGIGIDIDPRRIAEARSQARRHSADRLVTFLCQDARNTDLTEATVVTLFLEEPANLELRDLIRRQLQPGARVVSRRSGMADWTPDETEVVESTSGLADWLYLWRMEPGIARGAR